MTSRTPDVKVTKLNDLSDRTKNEQWVNDIKNACRKTEITGQHQEVTSISPPTVLDVPVTPNSFIGIPAQNPTTPPRPWKLRAPP